MKLVNIRTNPIEEITEWGIKTSDGQAYELDVIVFATGFDAMTGAMKEIDIKGRDGTSIRDKWKDGPHTYLGIMVSGFPNMFMITGPQSPGVKSQMIFACQQHVDWIGDCIKYAQRSPEAPHRGDARGRARLGAAQQRGRRLRRSIRSPIAGTWAQTFPASHGCSCPMSAASRPT